MFSMGLPRGSLGDDHYEACLFIEAGKEDVGECQIVCSKMFEDDPAEEEIWCSHDFQFTVHDVRYSRL